MSPEKELYLRNHCPLSFGSPFINDERFRCGDGWFDILETLGERLEREIAELPPEERTGYRCVQVKEKFGALRVYQHKRSTPAMVDLIAEAERASTQTCELCGKPGTLQTVGWIQTLCADCHIERQRELAKRGRR